LGLISNALVITIGHYHEDAFTLQQLLTICLGQVVRGEGRDLLPVRGGAGQPGAAEPAVRAVQGRQRGGPRHRGLQDAAGPGAIPGQLHALSAHRQLRLRALRQVHQLPARRICMLLTPRNGDFGSGQYNILFSCAGEFVCSLNLSGSRGQGAALLGDHCRWLRRLL